MSYQQTEILDSLSCLDYELPERKLSDNTEADVLNALIGSGRQTRLGAIPDANVQANILDRIKYKMLNNEPLVVVSSWGAKKTLPGGNEGVDIAELMAIKQYESIDRAIKKIYPPGIVYNLFLNDSYYEYLYGGNPEIEDYCRRMEEVAYSSSGQVNVIRTSSFHENDSSLYLEADKYSGALEQYLRDSQDVNPETWGDLESFQILNKLGWSGLISPELREHYMARLDYLFPGIPLADKHKHLSKYFGYALMIQNHDFFGRESQDLCTADFCVLRVPPPGMPKNLRGNRLRMRITTERIDKKTAPPWTVNGILLEESDQNLVPKIMDGTNIDNFDLVQEYDVLIGSAKINTPIYCSALPTSMQTCEV